MSVDTERAVVATAMPEPESHGRKAPRFKRVSLSLGAVVLTVLLLEGAARVFLPSGAPVFLRDGVFVSQLPVANGGVTFVTLDARRGVLPVTKRPGEVRVFVFGESSVEGVPWGAPGAAPTMLYDLLHAAVPGVDLTVVNMGRANAYSADVLYYLFWAERFQPDIVIFYLGMNDRYDISAEMCMPAHHPTLHAVWRFLVRHSTLVRTARVFGPTALAPADIATRVPDMPAAPLCPESTFAAWADLLVTTAQAMGARVIVTTPIVSALAPLDFAHAFQHVGKDGGAVLEPAALTGAYRSLVACALDPACDMEGQLAGRGEQGGFADWLTVIESRGAVWRTVAQRHGVPCVEFLDTLRRVATAAKTLDPFVVDDVHLTLEGYGFLARLWTQEVLRQLGQPQAAPAAVPTRSEQSGYETALSEPAGVILHRLGVTRLAVGLFLTGITALKGALRYGSGSTTEHTLDWLRAQLGDPAAAARLPEGFTPSKTLAP